MGEPRADRPTHSLVASSRTSSGRSPGLVPANMVNSMTVHDFARMTRQAQEDWIRNLDDQAEQTKWSRHYAASELRRNVRFYGLGLVVMYVLHLLWHGFAWVALLFYGAMALIGIPNSAVVLVTSVALAVRNDPERYGSAFDLLVRTALFLASHALIAACAYLAWTWL